MTSKTDEQGIVEPSYSDLGKCARKVLHLKESKLEDRLASAGGVPETLMDAVGALLTSKELDGMFIAAAISLPAATELIGSIPNIDPLLLHNVRCGPCQLRCGIRQSKPALTQPLPDRSRTFLRVGNLGWHMVS